jgi:hypothetical protein
MPAIHLPDHLYEQLRTRATDVGYASVDDYVADVLREELADTPNFDHLFIPERIAKLDQIIENFDRWEQTSLHNADKLRTLADEALDDLRTGRTTPLNPEAP